MTPFCFIFVFCIYTILTMSARTELDLYIPRPEWMRYLLTYGALFLGIVLAKTKVKGKHNIPNKGPYIIAANHFSLVDGFFVVYALQRPITFLVASDQVISWYFKWAAWLYGFIPVNRVKLSPSTIKKAKAVLQSNNILGIMPEGTSTDKKLRAAKRGIVYLSTLENTRVLPVSIYGLKHVWSNWLRGMRPNVKVQIGKPFLPYEGIVSNIDREEKIKIIGENIICRLAALLPEKTHGIVKGDKRIEQYARKNEL